MLNTYKSTFDKILKSSDKNKVLYLDDITKKIINNIYSPNKLNEFKIVGIILIEDMITNLDEFIGVYILSSLDRVNSLNVVFNTNEKYIYFLQESPLEQYKSFQSSLIGLKTLAYINIDFQPMFDNYILNITENNIQTIVKHANIIKNNKSSFDFKNVIDNTNNNNIIIDIENTDKLIDKIVQWSYYHLLYNFDIFSYFTNYVARNDPYYCNLWNLNYENAIKFINNEAKLLDSIDKKSSNYKMFQYKKIYIIHHLDFLKKLESVLNSSHSFDISKYENLALTNEISKNEFIKNNIAIGIDNTDNANLIYSLPKTKILQTSEYYYYLNRPYSLKNNIINIIKSLKLQSSHNIFVLVDKITIGEVIEINSINSTNSDNSTNPIIILDRQKIDCYVSYENNSIEHNINNNDKCFKINYIVKHKEPIIMNDMNDIDDNNSNFYNIERKINDINKMNKDVINFDMTKFKDLSGEVASEIKHNYEKLQLIIQSSTYSKIEKNIANNKLFELSILIQKYKKITSKNKIEETKFKNNYEDDTDYYDFFENNENNEKKALLMDQLMDRSNEILQREQDVIKLTQSMNELNELFLDIYLMVNEQGQMLNNIESNILSASDFVEKGTKELTKSEKLQKKGNKYLKYILGATMTGAIILSTAVGIKLKP